MACFGSASYNENGEAHRQSSPEFHLRLHSVPFLIVLLLAAAALADDGDGAPVQSELSTWSPVREKQLQTDSTEAPLISEEEVSCADDTWSTGTLIAGRLCVPVQRKLERCHEKALQRLQEMESCRQLFFKLGANGSEEIRKTIYLAAPRDQELGVCTCGAVAFTTVGNRQIFLCKRFSRLSDIQATFVLIHEALHSAGLDEHPRSSDAMSSSEITDMVRRRCGFRVKG
jgi:hypothetical protein